MDILARRRFDEDKLIAEARLDYYRNQGALSVDIAARLAEQGYMVSELEQQFEKDMLIDSVL